MRRPLLLALAAAGAVAAVAASTAPAAGGLAVTGAWARASAAGTTTGAAYFTVRAGATGDTLTGIAVDPAVARAAELHESMLDDMGMMSMDPVHAVPVRAGGSLVFKPGGHHVMLVGLKRPLRTGQRFTLTLRFARAGARFVTAVVRP